LDAARAVVLEAEGVEVVADAGEKVAADRATGVIL